MKAVHIHHGDSRDVSGRPLNQRVRAPVARLAQGDEVRKIVRLDVAGEQSERADVVNVHTRSAAMLAGAVVACLRLPLLRRPVRAAMMHGATFELRMKLADPVSVPTVTCAVEASALVLAARRAGEPAATPDAGDARPGDLARRYRCVLARRRAVLTATVFRARRRHSEIFPAVQTSNQNAGPAGREANRA